jgi:hypothetical protein
MSTVKGVKGISIIKCTEKNKKERKKAKRKFPQHLIIAFTLHRLRSG